MRTIVLMFFVVFNVYAQKTEKLEEYTASNGVTYKIGDEITLNKGSDTNGKFVYVTIGGWGVSSDGEANRLGALNSGLIVTVKKIKKYDQKRFKGVYFTVGGGNITNYNLDIENAIGTCEITPCIDDSNNLASTDKYDKLKKAKELFDSGVLTKEEFEAEKNKLLNQ